MYIILSQKIDTQSSYSDELYAYYHYPSKYKNQLNEGDIFVYYQGDRSRKEYRYYFGTGQIKSIKPADDGSYYAKLTDCKEFPVKVPIYLPDDAGYIEQLDFQSVRKSKTPPWQSSIRPLSEEAYCYILKNSGLSTKMNAKPGLEELKELLKDSIKRFYRENDIDAIHDIRNYSYGIEEIITNEKEQSAEDNFKEFLDYCNRMKMTYSYKPVLILAFLECSDSEGRLHMNDAIRFFKTYYARRREQGKAVEKKGSIYTKKNITDKEIRENIIKNPLNALAKSGYISFDENTDVMEIKADLWKDISSDNKTMLYQICIRTLEEYYKKI